jgi:hypothetical protein
MTDTMRKGSYGYSTVASSSFSRHLSPATHRAFLIGFTALRAGATYRSPQSLLPSPGYGDQGNTRAFLE